MPLLILLGCGLFLSSVVVATPVTMQFVLLLLFLLTGLLYWHNAFTTYLVFTFVYPFLPSQLFEISSFDYLEFVFLSLAFWWALDKLRQRNFRLLPHALTPMIGLFLLTVFFSVFLVMLKHHYLLSEVFVRKLQDNWNIFLPYDLSDPFAPFHGFLNLLEGSLFFYITIDLANTPERVGKVTRAILYAAGFVSILGVLQSLLKFQLIHYWLKENPNIVRINSTFSDPNSLGTYLATVICFGVFAYFLDSKRSGKLPAASLLFCLYALVLTASRAAWGAVFLSLLLLPPVGRIFGFDVSSKFRGVFRWAVRYGMYVMFFSVMTLLLVAAIVDYRNPQPDSLLQVVLFTFNPRLALNVILKGRLDMWDAALRMFLESPIFGIGLGSFGDRILHAPYFLQKAENAHNYFLQILAETGFTGFLFFVAMLLQLLRHGVMRLKAAPEDEFLRTYGFLSGLVAFLLTSFTGHPLLLLKLQFLFWSFAGMLMPSTPSAELKGPKTVLRNAVLLVLILAAAIQIGWTLRTRQLLAYEYGFYSWEKDGGDMACRWTASEGVSMLKVRGKILELQFRQLNPDLIKNSYNVSIYLNNELLDKVALTDTAWKQCRYFLPGVREKDLIQIRIVPERTFMPLRFGSDRRELGVQMGRFAWHCSLNAEPIGVYEKEHDGTANYYWTRTQASFPIESAVSKISFPLLPNSSVLNAPVKAQFFWNNHLLKTMELNRLDWTQVNLEIQHPSKDGILTIQVSPTANPKRMGLADDQRELGVRVGWPFRVEFAKTVQSSETGTPIEPAFYAISNIDNWPFRIFTCPLESVPPRWSLFRSGTFVSEQQGWIDSLYSSEPWISIFKPIDPDSEEGGVLSGKKRIPALLSVGPLLIRMTARGNMEAGEVPILRIAMNDREIARQPILSNEWHDYYFSVILDQSGKELSIELVNDLFDAQNHIDRNLFIKEIQISKKKNPTRKPGPGWEMAGKTLVIAEPVDTDTFFAPQNDCYRIEPVLSKK